MSQELTDNEKALLAQITKKAEQGIIAQRIPDEVMKKAKEILSIIDNDLFRKRTWFYHYEDGFHTLHKVNLGTDTDGKPCHVVFYLNFDVFNNYTSINIDTYQNNFGSNGLIATLLSYAGPYEERNIYSGLAKELVEHVTAFKPLREAADRFIEENNKFRDEHEDEEYQDNLDTFMNEEVERILGVPQKQESSQLDKATVS